jgi:drug/metabolite transporter (DMT)-like permease
VTNIAPLLVAFFSYFLHKVGLSKMDIANLIISFFGVAVLITGDSKSSGSQ